MEALIGDLAIGGFSGFSIGYAAKKFFKLLALITGAYLASLLWLNSRGYISVEWGAINQLVEGTFFKFSELNISVGTIGVGTIAGFAVGWRSG